MKKLVLFVVIISLSYLFKDEIIQVYDTYVGNKIEIKTDTGVVTEKQIVAKTATSLAYNVTINNRTYNVGQRYYSSIEEGQTIELYIRFNEIQGINIIE